MPTFQYRAVSVEGSALSGEISAADRKSAAARLQAQGHTPLSITELKPGSLQALLSRDLFAGEHLGAGALVKLIQQLSVLLGAGILVEDGLALLAGREGAPKSPPSSSPWSAPARRAGRSTAFWRGWPSICAAARRRARP
jgi:type II secretory pathway component PulF